MAHLVFDTEIFRTYYLAMFKDIDTGTVAAFEMFDGQAFNARVVRQIIENHTVITFNGANFDLPLLGAVLDGADCEKVKEHCNSIIVRDQRPWQLNLTAPKCDHIDLMEVAPGQASLKIYGGRLHSPTLQDLPFDPDDTILPEHYPTIRSYCENDLDLTARLYRTLEKQIDLRRAMSKQYGIDLRSKSDAQIAEAVIYQEVSRLRGDAPPKKVTIKPGAKFRYSAPGFIAVSPLVDFINGCEFVIDGNGAPRCPALDDHNITIGNTTYRMGIGGLHSCEKSAAHRADGETLLIDRDVASYYPSIIRLCGLYPKHMGPAFLDVYNGFIDQRLAAKHAGNKTVADTFKILLNGTFGKLGSRYSCLYSPRLLIQVTLTGQLALLMLIESLEKNSIPVVSANTDGIVIKCPANRQDDLNDLVWYWEAVTGFATEETCYRALYSRDVNNYVAIKTDGSSKAKGVFAASGLAKNPVAGIVTQAVTEHLTHGTPIDQTVTGCEDITAFLSVRTVSGGAVTATGEAIGKAIRWYYSTDATSALHYAKNGNKVPLTDGAMPCMTLPDGIPQDLDHGWYIKEAVKTLKTLGA